MELMYRLSVDRTNVKFWGKKRYKICILDNKGIVAYRNFTINGWYWREIRSYLI